METFTVHTPEGVNRFSFSPLVKNDTYAFLHFMPTKESPEKAKLVVTLYEKNNTLLEEHEFVLELDETGKNYQNNHIGLTYDGLKQNMIFKALNSYDNTPLEKICICVAVAKIKDGDDDDNGGGRFISGGPKSPYLINKKLYV